MRNQVFSIVIPMDLDRFELFKETKTVYDTMTQEKEFIIVTRHYNEVKTYLTDNNLMKDVFIVPYELDVGFNCSKALNIGVRNAKYKQVIITCPEVRPEPDVLDKLEKLKGKNVLCHVFDMNEGGNIASDLINTGYRGETPAMYFLAMFNKKDIEKINGWDEIFLGGYAWEDSDFGDRWVRAEIPFSVEDDIIAYHEYHPREETTPGGYQRNGDLYNKNCADKVIRCKDGLIKL